MREGGRRKRASNAANYTYITFDTQKRAEMMVGKFLTHRKLKEKDMEDLNLNPILREECRLLFFSVNHLQEHIN